MVDILSLRVGSDMYHLRFVLMMCRFLAQMWADKCATQEAFVFEDSCCIQDTIGRALSLKLTTVLDVLVKGLT